jgi:NADPH2:quinone reductase
MRAIRVGGHGGAEVLRLEEAPDPRPGAGEVLVRVEAAGVNFIEIYQRMGMYPVAPPFTPGTEGAGTVIDVGEGADGVRPGDRVASVALRGSYAELSTADADKVIVLPDDVDTRTAAAIMLQGMTAHYLATSTFPLSPGDTCLVHAAAGGVGLLLCQIAAKRGARVIGTVSTKEKAALARDAGAAEVILYTQQSFAEEVKRLTNGRGVRVVFDSVGRTTFEDGLGCLAPRGMMVLFGQSSGSVRPLDPQILNRHGSLYLTRPSLAYYVATREELLARATDLMHWIRDGALRVRIDREFPLAYAADAHRALESRATAGKLLLRPE